MISLGRVCEKPEMILLILNKVELSFILDYFMVVTDSSPGVTKCFMLTLSKWKKEVRQDCNHESKGFRDSFRERLTKLFHYSDSVDSSYLISLCRNWSFHGETRWVLTRLVSQSIKSLSVQNSHSWSLSRSRERLLNAGVSEWFLRKLKCFFTSFRRYSYRGLVSAIENHN